MSADPLSSPLVSFDVLFVGGVDIVWLLSFHGNGEVKEFVPAFHIA